MMPYTKAICLLTTINKSNNGLHPHLLCCYTNAIACVGVFWCESGRQQHGSSNLCFLLPLQCEWIFLKTLLWFVGNLDVIYIQYGTERSSVVICRPWVEQFHFLWDMELDFTSNCKSIIFWPQWSHCLCLPWSLSPLPWPWSYGFERWKRKTEHWGKSWVSHPGAPPTATSMVVGAMATSPMFKGSRVQGMQRLSEASRQETILTVCLSLWWTSVR